MARKKSKPAKRQQRAAANGQQNAGRIIATRPIARFTQRSAAYAATLADPRRNQGARIPIPPMVPSATLAACARISFTSSSVNGYAYVLVNPFRLVANNLSGGGQPILTSASAYAGAFAFDYTTVPTPTFTNSNSPYVLADFAATTVGGLKYRLVSANIVVSYAGTELGRGGTYLPVCDPAGGSLLAVTGAFVSQIPHVNDIRITEKDVSVNWCPCDADDFEYKSNPTNDGLYCMGILIATATNSSPLVAEVTANYELVGAKAAGATAIGSDTDGALAVAASAAARHVGGQQGPGMSVQGILKDAGRAIVDTTSAVMAPIAEGAKEHAGKATEQVGKWIGRRVMDYIVDNTFSSGAPRIEL